MLFTKCILSEPAPEDGIRISVMSRHTLSDGATPDVRIEGKFDQHIPLLGPSPRLIGDYYKRGLGWEEFKERYRQEVNEEPKLSLLKKLAREARHSDLTLLCIEEGHSSCHRSILAEECLRLEPSLEIEHR